MIKDEKDIQLRIDSKKVVYGKFDERNKLNDLTGKEWLQLTKSVWFSEAKENHLFSLEDIENLVKLFTKKGMTIVNISPHYESINEISKKMGRNIMNIDIRNEIQEPQQTVQFLIGGFNFPNILNLETQEPRKLIDLYQNFLSVLERNFKKLLNKLEEKKYLSLITNDFEIDDREINNTTNIIRLLQKMGFIFKGKIILSFNGSDTKSTSNNWFTKNHVFILIFQKNSMKKIGEKNPTKIHLPSKFFVAGSKRLNLEHLDKNEKNKYLSTVWFSKTVLDDIGKIHPAPFSYLDVKKLIEIFTRKDSVVLDPFTGVSSTLIACGMAKRKGIGIDLNEDYIKLSEKRLQKFDIFDGQTLVFGDSLIELDKIKNATIDYCVTSPPYHNILRNSGGGVRSDESQFRQGVKYYSEKSNDLGNQKSYTEYLDFFKKIMKKTYKKLRRGSYCSVVISDFTVDKHEANASGDIIDALEKIGFVYKETIILVQNQKALYPFGYPYAFVINHIHQNVLNFQKL